MLTNDKRRKALSERVDHWARRLKVQPPKLRVQPMTRKWGSCSTSGNITLASDLADQESGFQDFVIAHELVAPSDSQPRKVVQGVIGCACARLEKVRYRKTGCRERKEGLNK